LNIKILAKTLVKILTKPWITIQRTAVWTVLWRLVKKNVTAIVKTAGKDVGIAGTQKDVGKMSNVNLTTKNAGMLILIVGKQLNLVLINVHHGLSQVKDVMTAG